MVCRQILILLFVYDIDIVLSCVGLRKVIAQDFITYSFLRSDKTRF